MRRLLLSLFVLTLPAYVTYLLAAPSDSTDRWFNRLIAQFTHDDRPADKPRFLLYPTLGYSPETSWEFGAAGSILFHAKNDPQRNRLSEVTLFGFGTLRAQYGIWLDNAIYTDRDQWIVLGRLRFQRFPLLYYGVGPEAPAKAPTVVNGTYFLMRQRAFHRLAPNWFFGPEIDIQSLSRVDFGGEHLTRPLPPGAEGSTNFGIGMGTVYDSRPNMLNTRNGWFAELSWLHYDRAWGSDYGFNLYFAEVRRYKNMGRGQVLALQALGSIVEGEAPFNQLSLMGNESLMRGYYTGRYRDRHYYAAQAEYRFLPLPFSKYLGAAAFFGVGAVAPSFSALSLRHVRWAGGVGLRYLIFPKKDIFVRFDMGLTREGPAFYLFTGEAF
ncbi:MAG: BamA/TamA family outer membrane protein [Saprospiraceae bacterium]|nr:outer membrane protein assembly factor [Saprospiraceae bacterium]MDW8229434.1 BamA/TamA family outer membrane protein [Saprospiraceae bacterium]